VRKTARDRKKRECSEKDRGRREIIRNSEIVRKIVEKHERERERER
jgi:hypothetical protein